MCTHTTQLTGQWIANPSHDPEEFDAGGFDSGPYEWEPGGEESCFVDIDLHRMKCTKCGEIKYYSDKARRHYEDGELFNIKGLDGESS